MQGRTLDRYKVGEVLGAGGMGVVYRAHDTRLDRDVALKVLPAGLLEDGRARRRFKREALALSRLNHPNIATVHDFNSADGVDYIVMELVAGASLEAYVSQGPLEEEQLLSVGVQMAEGLTAAHSAGVLHQDLKPANLRLTPDGRLKILDFGLATLVRPAADGATAPLTAEDRISGTLQYMAPEQFSGKADERSDVYQAGMVLYELGTGTRAFDAKQPAELMRAILYDPPVPPRDRNPHLPAALDPLILKAIDKSPDRRYQTSRELLVDLRRASGSPSSSAPLLPSSRASRRGIRALTTAAILVVLFAIGFGISRWISRPIAGVQSLAVLPLTNVSGDPAQAFFADGMTYELITQLGKISDNLRVTSQTSIVRYKGSTKTIPEVARELGVAKIIEGSVLRSGDRIRVTVTLVDGKEDRQLWSQSYERDVNDLIALQAEIAQVVAEEVRARLTLPVTAARTARTVDRRAYDEYLHGLFQQLNMPMNPMMARQHFQRSAAIDPKYAAPYAGLAETYVAEAFFAKPLAPMEAFPRAKELAMRAIELDPDSASAYVSRGVARVHSEWDWKAAESDFKRAIALNPSLSAAHHWYAHLLLALDRTQESVVESERASQLDPDNVMWGSCVGWHCLYARQYDASIARLQSVIRTRPNHFLAHLYLGRAYDAKGMYPQSIAEFRTAVNQSGGSGTVLASLAHTLARGGQRSEAESILAQLLTRSQTEYISAYDIAVVYAGLRDNDKAFDWLEKSYLERSAWLAHIKWDERFTGLRSDPRFASLLKRIRLPVSEPAPA